MEPHLSTHVKLLAADLLTLTPSPTHPSTLLRHARPITRAETLGIITSLDRTNKFLRFLVDDGSGCVPCILWLNHYNLPHRNLPTGVDLDLEAEMALGFAEKVRLGELVRVRGRVGVFRGSVQITVGDVVVERDANVEVMFWLECVRLARLCYDVKKAKP